jgi:uncharacterized membrane protein YeaQ/YmgE (transglycosylase-associated protein family)
VGGGTGAKTGPFFPPTAGAPALGPESDRDDQRAVAVNLAWEEKMEIIWTIVIGLVAGIVAKLLMPGKDPGGFIITILLGIAGAFVATYLGQAVGWYGPEDNAGFIGAVVGAVILLIAYRFVKGRQSS